MQSDDWWIVTLMWAVFLPFLGWLGWRMVREPVFWIDRTPPNLWIKPKPVIIHVCRGKDGKVEQLVTTAKLTQKQIDGIRAHPEFLSFRGWFEVSADGVVSESNVR